jgi:hypothetical protein
MARRWRAAATLLASLAVASVALVVILTIGSSGSPPVGTSGSDSAQNAVDGRASAAPITRVEISPSLERSCRTICDHSRRLGCENTAKCLPNCRAMGSATPCTEPILAMYQCLVAQPVQNWECAPDGVAAIRVGFCDAEQGQAVACMKAKMAR